MWTVQQLLNVPVAVVELVGWIPVVDVFGPDANGS